MPTLANRPPIRPATWLAALALCATAAGARPACAEAPTRWNPDRAPSTVAADGVQAGAPALNSASPELLDRAGFPRFGAVAWDERFQEGPNDRALTFSASGAGLAALFRRPRPGEDVRPGREAPLGRFAARVSLGGPLQFIAGGRASRAGRETNHITSELKVRLAGPASPRAGVAVLALALDADNFATGYGLDRYGATLVAERPGTITWVGNAGWRLVEKYKAPERLDEAKLGLGAHRRLPGHAGPPGELDLGASGAVLLRNDGRPAVWQGGLQLEVRLSHNLRAGLALRTSSAPEMPAQERTMGVMSFAADLGPGGR